MFRTSPGSQGRCRVTPGSCVKSRTSPGSQGRCRVTAGSLLKMGYPFPQSAQMCLGKDDHVLRISSS